MLVIVTPNDVKHGQRHMTEYCPIARALTRKTGIVFKVAPRYIYGPTVETAVYRTPALARWFIKRFDNNQWVPKYFAFIL